MDQRFPDRPVFRFRPVTIRRMFSGYGISADWHINFALALRAGLYFRADDATIPSVRGSEDRKPFSYQTRTKTWTVNSYWQLPARLFDDSEDPLRMGEGGTGGSAARGVAQAPEGEQGGEEGLVRKAVVKKSSIKKKSRCSRVGKAKRAHHSK